jgi:hypothetical protein
MVKTLNTQVSNSKLTLFDIAGIAVTKNVSERLLTPLIGNGTITSGVIKSVAGVLASSMLKGKMGDILGTAWVVDGTEDIVTAFLGGNGSSSISSRGTSSNGVRVL